MSSRNPKFFSLPLFLPFVRTLSPDIFRATIPSRRKSLSRLLFLTFYLLGVAWTGIPGAHAQTAVAPTAGDDLTTATALQLAELGNRVGGTARSDTSLYPLVTNPGNGSITRKPNQATYSPGTKVLVTAQAAKGYHFARWTGDVPPGSETQNPLTVTMDSTRTLTARFEPNQYHLVVRAEHGSVQQLPSLPNYSYGTKVTLVPRPETGYHFGWWSDSKTTQSPWWTDGTVDPTTSPLTFTVTADTTVTAFFRRIYEIRTLDELQNIATGDLKGYYTLMNDIDASDTANWNDEGTTEGLREGFRPIGKYQDFRSSFQGVFDGNGKKITGLTINRPKENGVGLFGCVIEGGTVKNLTLEGGAVTGNDNVGGMIGCTSWGTKFIACTTSMTVTGHETTGGMIGKMSCGEIMDCSVHGSVMGHGYTGGLVGEASPERMTGCATSCSVTGNAIGGLIGSAETYNSKIENCTASGKLIGTSLDAKIGGLIGVGIELGLDRCSASVEITGLGRNVGGLVGFCYAGNEISGCTTSGPINVSGNNFPAMGGLVGSCYGFDIHDSSITGPVTGTSTDSSGARVGGLVGLARNIGIDNCHVSSTVRSDSVAGGLIGGNEEFYWIFGSSVSGSVTGSDYTGGFIGYGSACSVADNSFTSATVTGRSFVGGLIGYAEGCQIVSCTATGSVTGTGTSVGGLIGEYSCGFFGCVIHNCTSSGPITGCEETGGLIGGNYIMGPINNCTRSGDVIGNGSYVGGLIGNNEWGEVLNCSASGSTVGIGSYVGGLIGNNNGWAIKDSSTSGSVTATGDFTGGLIGNNGDCNVERCFATVSVISAGAMSVGGLIGENKGYITTCYSSGAITATEAIGVGGLIGTNVHNAWYEVVDCYSMSSVNGSENVGGLIGDNQNEGTGTIRCFATGATKGNRNVGGLVGRNCGLHLKVEDCFASGPVKGDTNVGGLVGYSEIAYVKIGNCCATGSVTGGGNVGGLVGYSNGPEGIIQSFAIGDVTGTSSSVGGLIGNNKGIIDTSYATGAVTGIGNVGGLVGAGDHPWIAFCYASGSVTGNSTSIGGLVGNNKGTIEVSYATGSVNGEGMVGGFIGKNNASSIANCYATGHVTGTSSSIGGLIGNNEGPDTYIRKCYASGPVTGTGSAVGGLIGESTDSTVTACYWDVETSSQTVSAGGTGAIGKTTQEMKTQTTFQPGNGKIESDWDFDYTWKIMEGESSPYFSDSLTNNMPLPPVSLTLRVEGPGTVQPILPDGLYAYGTVVTLRAKPAPGYRLVRWAEPLPTGTVPPNPLALELTQDTSLTARFELAHPPMWVVR